MKPKSPISIILLLLFFTAPFLFLFRGFLIQISFEVAGEELYAYDVKAEHDKRYNEYYLEYSYKDYFDGTEKYVEKEINRHNWKWLHDKSTITILQSRWFPKCTEYKKVGRRVLIIVAYLFPTLLFFVPVYRTYLVLIGKIPESDLF